VRFPQAEVFPPHWVVLQDGKRTTMYICKAHLYYLYYYTIGDETDKPSILTDIGCSRTNSERRRIMKRIGNHADEVSQGGFLWGLLLRFIH
jgi:hypothetical protein